MKAQSDLSGADFPLLAPDDGGPPPPQQLPAGLTAAERMVGREAELTELAALLPASRTGKAAVISAISGTAGVGKTSLAVHWALQVAAEFPDGQLYVNLQGSGPSRAPMRPAEAVTGLLHALGATPEQTPGSPDEQLLLYRKLLASKRVLLVLDNASNEEQVRPLLPVAPGSLAIVTSRDRLDGLAGLGSRMLTLDVLTEPEARDLMTAGLGPERLSAEPAAVSELASLCARLPLTLAIATAHARTRPQVSLAAMASELRDARAGLAGQGTGDLALSVRAVFTWARASLTPAAAEMFRLLGLHPGPDITAPAAASLAGISSLPSARDLLADLAGRRLLTEPVPGRYALHDLLRAYAAEQAEVMDDAAARRAALGRTLDHYLSTAHAAAVLVNPSREPIKLDPAMARVPPEPLEDSRQALAWFEAERHALLSAVTVAADAGFGVHAWQIAWTMTDFLDWRGLWLDLAAISSIALAAATDLGDIAGQATTSRMVAYTHARAGDYDRARAYLTDCLALCRKAGHRALEARMYLTLGWVCCQERRHFDALSHAEQALALFRAIGDRDGEAHALNNVGYCHLQLGDRRRARMSCEQAVLIAREEGSTHCEAVALDSLGETEHLLGRNTEAIGHYERAISLFLDVGDRHGEAETLVHLGDAHDAAGDPLQAETAWKQALAIFGDLHHPGASRVQRKLRIAPPESQTASA